MKKYQKIIPIILTSTIIASGAYATFASTNNNNQQVSMIDNETTHSANLQVVNDISQLNLTSDGNSDALFALVKGDGVTTTDLLYAWGLNISGQLGLSSNAHHIATPSIVPFALTPSERITHILAGESFTLIIVNNRIMWAAGDNSYGCLGDGTFNNSRRFILAHTFAEDITSISVAAVNTAVIVGNKLYAWGGGLYGFMGAGEENKDNANTPTEVTAMTGKTLGEVRTSGYGISATTLKDGKFDQLYVWGLNATGELGLSTSEKVIFTPTLFNFAYQGKLLKFFITPSVIFIHTYDAADAAHPYKLYGAGPSSYLGLGIDAAPVITPTLIPNLPNVEINDIRGGFGNTLIETKDGDLYATGYGRENGLGFDTKVFKQLDISDVSEIVTFASGSIIVKDNKLYAWGDNNFGQFGIGTDYDKYLTYYPIDPFDTPSEILQSPTEVVSHVYTADAALEIYNGSINLTGFEKYVDVESFPADVEFSMNKAPVVDVIHGTLSMTVTADRSYSQPNGAKAVIPKDYYVVLTGFKVHLDSIIKVIATPSGADIETIIKALSSSPINKAELGKLIQLGYFPSTATFKTSGGINNSTDSSLISFALVPSEIYAAGVAVANDKPMSVIIYYVPLPVDDNFLYLIIGLSVFGGLLLLAILVLCMLCFYKKPQITFKRKPVKKMNSKRSLGKPMRSITW